MEEILFSVIIPHCNSVQYLPKLFSSIPVSTDIEIIIVDNSPVSITKKDIGVDRDYILLFSDHKRGAGGARNVGVENAHGKWLLFLDADDYFAKGAFDIFYSKVQSASDIIYTCMGGIYLDTGAPSNRGDVYTNLVKSYLKGEKSEYDLRYGFASPCCKMIRRELINKYNILFDEIVAGNDQYFSLVSGFYAKSVEAIDYITYIATVSRGSLTKRRDFEVMKARLYSKLHYNQFLKQHGIKNRQQSVLFPFIDGKHLGIKAFMCFIGMIIKFRQNPFIGVTRWYSTLLSTIKINKRDRAYITK